MNNKIIKYIGTIIASVLLFSNTLNAKPSIEKIELIEIVGGQGILSQRIVKDYLYVGKNIAITKTQEELKISFERFFKAHTQLFKTLSSSEMHNILESIARSSNALKEVSTKPFNLDNAQQMLDLSESVLSKSQYLMDSLNKSSEFSSMHIVEKATKQQMFAQRIAKYYIAYQLGIQNQSTVTAMKKTLEDFQENLNFLIKNESNTLLINEKLKEVNTFWKIVHKFYNNIEKGGLPLIVFDTTDKITTKMHEVTSLYISMYK